MAGPNPHLLNLSDDIQWNNIEQHDFAYVEKVLISAILMANTPASSASDNNLGNKNSTIND
jgi:hypothetical protein